MKKMKSPAKIFGTNFLKFSNSIQVKLLMNSKEFVAITVKVIKDTELEFQFSEINETSLSVGNLWISFTNGINYIQIQDQLTLIGK